MKTLLEYIKESQIGLCNYMQQQLLLEAYDQCAKDWETLLKHIKNKRTNNLCTDEFYGAVHKLLEQIIDKGDNFYAVYDKSTPVFKMSRYYVNNVDNLFSNGNIKIDKYEFSCVKKEGTDRIIYCENIVNSKKQHIKVFELGTGSIGKIKTEEQEQATVSIWNYLIDNDINILQNENRYKTIEDSVSDLTDAIKMDPTWIKSCVRQIEQIKAFLTDNRKIPEEQIKNYRAIRYGYKDPENKNDKVAQAHELFLKKYLNLVAKANDYSGARKDNYDPSDILIYDSTKEDQIAGVFANLMNEMMTDTSEVFNKYKNLFNKNLLFGISLKKISSNPSFELFNIERNGGTIKDYVCKNIKIDFCGDAGQGALARLSGDFDFKGIANPENPDEHLETKELKVSIRTFGSGNIGIDIAETKGPALGKVPVNIWRKLLDVNDHADLQTCKNKFKKEFNKENPNIDVIKEIIVAGVKSGPWCLPFVLVH